MSVTVQTGNSVAIQTGNRVIITAPGPQGPPGSGGGGTPGGTNTQVQFNDAGAFGGDAGMTYNKATDTLSATNLTVSGLSTLNHIHGSLAGNLYVHIKNTSGVTIAKGTPVYATGSVGTSGEIEVAAADFTNSAKMPAIGITDSQLIANAEGNAVVVGEITGLATNTYTINQELFVGTAALTGTLPTTGEAQSVAIVSRVHASTGIIVVNTQARLNAALRALANNVGSGLTALNASNITSGSLADAYIASAATWNAKQNAGAYITALTGDVTASGPGSVAATLANTAVTPGSYSSANITVDSKGRVTAAANGSGGTVTSVAMTVPAGLAVTGSPITSNGTLAVSYDTGYQGFTAAESSKLAGIEASADVTDAANVGAAIHGAAVKTTPVDADALPVIDSAASNALKKTTWANIKATLKTYFDTLYNLYVLPTPTTTVIGGVKRNTGSAGQFVNGIDTDGALQYGTPSGGGSGDMTKAVYDPRNLNKITGLPGTDNGSQTGGLGGSISIEGGNAGSGSGENGGAAGAIALTGGDGSSGAAGGEGGSVITTGNGSNRGGNIQTNATSFLRGGDIFTAGGGDINTAGTGSIGLGATGTRTTIQGAASADWTLTLPTNDGSAGQYLKTDGSGVTSWDTPGGTGTVTSVAISGTDGIEVDSGSPITSSGTIQLGVNAATMKTTLDLTGTNSGDVTLAGTPDYITISGQTITRNAIDLAADVTGTLPASNGGTGITALGTGVATALGQNVTGSGSIVLGTSPTLTTPALGTPSALTLTNATGLPLTTGVTGILPIANIATGTPDGTKFVRDDGTLATPAGSGTVTSVGGTGTVNGITLSGTVTSSGNLTLGGALSGVDLTTQVTGTLPIANGGTGQTTQTAAFDALAPTTTKGDLIVHNGTDNIRVPVGATNGHVLTVDSAEASGVKWAAGGGGSSGAMVLLASATASSSAEILFDNEFDSALYSEYELRIQGAQPATDNVTLRIQLRDAGGNLTATYRQGQVAQRIDATGTANASNVNSTAGFDIAVAGNSTNELTTGVMFITPLSGQWCHSRSHWYITGPSTDRFMIVRSGAYESTTAPTGLRVYCSSGNISIGTFQLYGILK